MSSTGTENLGIARIGPATKLDKRSTSGIRKSRHDCSNTFQLPALRQAIFQRRRKVIALALTFPRVQQLEISFCRCWHNRTMLAGPRLSQWCLVKMSFLCTSRCLCHGGFIINVGYLIVNSNKQWIILRSVKLMSKLLPKVQLCD